MYMLSAAFASVSPHESSSTYLLIDGETKDADKVTITI